MFVVLQERFRDRLREAMNDGDWTQASLAAALGISQQVVSSYVNGKRTPGLDVVERFANALGLDDPMDLLRSEEEARRKVSTAS